VKLFQQVTEELICTRAAHVTFLSHGSHAGLSLLPKKLKAKKLEKLAKSLAAAAGSSKSAA